MFGNNTVRGETLTLLTFSSRCPDKWLSLLEDAICLGFLFG